MRKIPPQGYGHERRVDPVRAVKSGLDSRIATPSRLEGRRIEASLTSPTFETAVVAGLLTAGRLEVGSNVTITALIPAGGTFDVDVIGGSGSHAAQLSLFGTVTASQPINAHLSGLRIQTAFSAGGHANVKSHGLYITTGVGTGVSEGWSIAVVGAIGTTRSYINGHLGLGASEASLSTQLDFTAGSADASPLRVPHGVAPTAPVDGDIWTTTAGLFTQINGVTVGPLGSAGTGDVVGPAGATDNAVARFNTATGKLLQNSVVTIDDTGAVAGVSTLAAATSVTAPLFIGNLQGTADEAVLADVALLANEATALETSRTIFGVAFDGTGNVSGAFSGATTGAFSGDVAVGGGLTVSAQTQMVVASTVMQRMRNTLLTADSRSFDFRIESDGGTASNLSVRTTTDAGSTVVEAIRIHHTTGLLTALHGITVSSGAALTVNSPAAFSDTITAQTIRGADGSASAPTYAFTSDTDSGMYLAATGILRFVTASAARLSISSSGLSTVVPLLYTGSDVTPIELNRSTSADNVNIRYQNTTGSLYAGKNASHFAIAATANLGASPWLTVSSTAATLAGTLAVGGAITAPDFIGNLTGVADEAVLADVALLANEAEALEVQLNGTYLRWRNGADSADLNVMRVTAANSVEIEAPVGAGVQLRVNGTNILAVNFVGAAVTGTLTTSGAINGQTIGSAASFDGSITVATTSKALILVSEQSGWTTHYTANATGSYVNALGVGGTFRVLLNSVAQVTFGTTLNTFVQKAQFNNGVLVQGLAGSGTRPVAADSSGNLVITTAGSGDVTGPGSATDNAIARFNLTTGKVIQNSSATISDAGQLNATSYAVGGTAGDSDTIDTAAGTWEITVSGGIVTSIVQTS